MSQLSTYEKLSEVSSYLERLFGDEPIPSFDQSDDFISRLYSVVCQQQQFERDVITVNEFRNQLSAEYERSLECIDNVLNSLGIDSECTESSDVVCLADVAHILNIGDVDDTTFILGMTELLSNKEKTTLQLDTHQSNVDQNRIDIESSAELVRQLEILTDNKERDRDKQSIAVRNQTKETAFLLQKVVKYQLDKKKLESCAPGPVNPAIKHSALVADHEKLEKLTSRLAELKAQVELYSALPPDKDLARVKLEVAKDELSEIEDKLSKSIDLFHL